MLVRQSIAKILMTVFMVLMTSCGQVVESTPDESVNVEAQNSVVTDNNISKEFIEIEVTLSSDTDNLNLLGISDVNVTVSGCLSGFSDTITVSTTLKVYKADRNCRVIVNSFTSGSEIYNVKAGYTFNANVNQLTPFTGSLGGELFIKVITQLPDPILVDSSVSFLSLEITRAADYPLTILNNILAAYADQTSVDIASDSTLSYTIKKVTEADTNALTVNYSLSGNAISTEDYNVVTGTVVIPANQKSVVLPVTLVNDNLTGSTKNIEFNFENGNYYYYTNPSILITDPNTTLPSSTNLKMRLDSSSIVGSAVTSWTDLSGAAHPATQGTSANRPLKITGGLNSLDTVRFDGSNDFLSIASNSDLNSATSYTQKTVTVAFVTGTNITRRQVIYCQGSNSRGLNIYLDSSRIYANAWNTAADDATTPWGPKYVSAPVDASTAYVFTLVFDQVNNYVTAYLSGSFVDKTTGVGNLFGSTQASGLGGVTAASATRFHDNSTTTTSTYFGGDLVQVMHHNGLLTAAGISSDSLIKDLHAYLKGLYNLNSKPSVSVARLPTALNETSGAVEVFRLSLHSPATSDLTINYTVGGTATSGSDYTALGTTAIIESNHSTVDIPITVINDSTFENDETITLTINSSSDYIGGGSTATASIIDDEVYTAPTALFAWYNAPQGLNFSTGSLISQWNDKTATALNAFQTTGSLQPTYNSTTQSIDFNAASNLYINSNSNMDSAGPYTTKTFALAFKTGSNVTTKQVLYEQGTSAFGLNMVIQSGTLYFTGHNNETSTTYDWGPLNVTTAIVANTVYEVIYEFDSANTAMRGKINRVTLTPISTGVKRLGTHSSNQTGIGAVRGSIRYWDNSTSSTSNSSKLTSGTKIYELMLFNALLSPADYTSLETYLINKYAIP